MYAIKAWEGGYVNHPYGPGGETKYGISKRSHLDLDVPSIIKEDAALIYYNDFWKSLRYNAID